MNEEVQEMIIDLLTKKATFGLDADEQLQLDELNARAGIAEDITFEITAAAIELVGLRLDEPMPEHLNARILASADDFFASMPATSASVEPGPTPAEEDDYQKVFTVEPRNTWNWLGWAVAAAACIILAVNVWNTPFIPTEVGGPTKTPPPTPLLVTPEQELAQLLASQASVIKATWGGGNMKELTEVGGEVVWSDEKQKGFMRLRGLPINDKSKETYQLWIFDKTQDKATPIDGGTFDVNKDGEVVIPIDAKLKAREPELFAITVEKPGGVVVSKREKIAALAKVEPPVKSNT